MSSNKMRGEGISLTTFQSDARGGRSRRMSYSPYSLLSPSAVGSLHPQDQGDDVAGDLFGHRMCHDGEHLDKAPRHVQALCARK